MCGILGTFRTEAGALADVERALQHLAHRGPDDGGIYQDLDARVWLGHRRLSIIDLSPLGHQPMLSSDARFVLVFNGEIYNFRELRAELQRSGVAFRGHSDTEVLLALFMEQRLSMLHRLNGMFAFAVYDRVERELVLVRDAMGVKPLYYSQTPSGFSFATELKALLCLHPGRPSLNLAALHRYLTYLWCPGTETPFQGVFKVEPGEALIVRHGRVAEHSRWFELPLQQAPTLPRLRGGAAVEAARASLRTAVHRQMVSDVPVGAFLSGGLDSSAVVAFAREQTQNIQCFTIESSGGAETGDLDDLPYARRVAAHLKVPLEVVTIDSARMASDLERMVYLLDEPLADPAPLNVLYIAQLARRTGVKVLLSGAGGDDLFTGYRRHLIARFDGLLDCVPSPLLRLASRLTDGLDKHNPSARRLGKLLWNAHNVGNERLTGYFDWTREADLQGLYTSEVRCELASVLAGQPMLDFLKTVPSERSTLEKMLSLEQRFFLADHNLPYTDKMSMAAGVEVRVPFLDVDLVRLASRIADRDKLRGWRAKFVLKKAMEPYLPGDVIYRAKTGFGAPLRRWMRGELRELLGDMLSTDSLRRRGLFDPAAVHRLIAENSAGRSDAAYTLFALLCVEIWCRSFIDQKEDLYPKMYGLS